MRTTKSFGLAGLFLQKCEMHSNIYLKSRVFNEFTVLLYGVEILILTKTSENQQNSQKR